MAASGATKESLLPPLWVLTLVTVAVAVWLVIKLKEIVVLLVVGYSIAYVIDPWLSWLEKRGVSRSGGVFLTVLLAVLLVLLLALTALPTIFREYSELSTNLPGYLEQAREKFVPLIRDIKEVVPDAVKSRIKPESVVDFLPAVGGGALKKLTGAVSAALFKGYSFALFLINLALLPFIVFYLAVDWKRFHEAALSFFPIVKRSKVRQIFLEIDSYVSSFVRGQLLVGLVLFLLYAAGLGLVGVELWFLLAFISGFGNLIPYLGFLCGIILSSIMALVTFGDWWHLLLVWGVYAIVQALEGTLITPRILGNKVGLSPLVIILAIVAGGVLFGLLGIFLAVPVAAALRVLILHAHDWVLSNS
ncbi:MAG: AI-2E family transporter [Candidatus Dadabacteria bacterium]|nr:MAG: AI-2E family transporter [Candidatus Dadabacteria bacterium]